MNSRVRIISKIASKVKEGDFVVIKHAFFSERYLKNYESLQSARTAYKDSLVLEVVRVFKQCVRVSHPNLSNFTMAKKDLIIVEPDFSIFI